MTSHRMIPPTDHVSTSLVTAQGVRTDVDKDRLDVLGAQEQLEGLLDGIGSSSSSDIELTSAFTPNTRPPCTHEVGGLSTVQVEDIHGSHSKTSTDDQASDVTVELDKVQTVLGSLDLLGILLGGVSELEDVLLSEVGIVIETKLGVHAARGSARSL